MNNQSQGKTIITYLVNGSGSGIKSLNILNRTIKCLYVPRIRLDEAKKDREELKCVSLYFLLSSNKEAYIGQTGNFLKRQSKYLKHDFWDELLIFSLSESLTTPAINPAYLECIAIKEAKKANIFNLERNKNLKKKIT